MRKTTAPFDGYAFLSQLGVAAQGFTDGSAEFAWFIRNVNMIAAATETKSVVKTWTVRESDANHYGYQDFRTDGVTTSYRNSVFDGWIPVDTPIYAI